MKMTKIVRTTADLFFPFCLVFGLYVVVHGHLTPGGGFQGGAVMATGTALLLVARSYDDVTGRIRKGAMKACEAAGLLIFLGAGFSGLFAGRPFMVGPHHRFAHAASYVRQRLDETGFDIVEITDITVRMEEGEPIPGHLVLAKYRG